MASKGKAIAKDSSGKRKRGEDNNDKTGGGKRKNRSVLQFFEDSAFECDGLSSDDSDDDFFNDIDFLDELDADPKVKSEPGRFEWTRVYPKEEELSGDELENFLAERYGSGSKYVRYAEDDYDNKRSVDRGFLIPSVVEPTIWKVKCKVGRERNTVFCLMQKYVDLKVLGTKLQIISAFAVEHIKGFVFIEAENQSDVTQACNQLADVYFSLVTKVPENEVSQLLVVRKRYHEVKEGTWARVKNGIYKGDIAQVVAVNNGRKRATVKLIPRIDLQALAEKYGGGSTLKKGRSGVPAPAARLITPRDLEEFRPLMQYRRDRDTGKFFEFLDGLMLKDGFVFKKVSIDSLSFWDVNPTEEEIQKFTLPSNDESDNMEWLSQLYGEQKKKCSDNKLEISKGGGKGEGSSGSNEQSSFEVYDLVLFGKRDFGMVIGMEKDETYKIVKYGSEVPVTMEQKDLKYLPLDKKFTALDHRMKMISVNDTARVLEGPTKGRQGIVKQIYRGIIFLYDENDMDNAYFCAKSQMSEKVKHTECGGKDEQGPSGFEDVPSSPKSPLSPKKPWQMREDVERGDKDGMFSVGQALRIRIGPLKGYLCRVLAIRRSDVTVKLDSQQKVLTVKREHLAEVRGKSSATSIGDDAGLNSSFKPFNLLGSDSSTNDWLQGAGGSEDGGGGWNVGGGSDERGGWAAFPSSGAALQVGTSASVDDSGKDGEESSWLSKAISNQNSTWGAAGNDKAVGNSDQDGAWGTAAGSWGKNSGAGTSSSWGNAKVPGADNGGSWNIGGSGTDQGKEVAVGQAAGSWGKKSGTGTSSSWGNAKVGGDDGGSWSIGGSSTEQGKEDQAAGSWGKKSVTGTSSSWGNANTPGVDHGGSWNIGGSSADQGKEDPVSQAAGSWGKKSSTGTSSSWGNAKVPGADNGGAWNTGGSNTNQGISNETNSWGKKSVEKGVADTWNLGKGAEEAGGWSNSGSGVSAGPSGWGKGKGTESQEQGTGNPGGDAWGEAKGSGAPAGDAWGKAAGNWGNKNSSHGTNEWKGSSGASVPQSGGWGKPQGQNEGGGWKKKSLDEQSDGKWGKSENASDWGKSGGNSEGTNSWRKPEGTQSWDQSRGGDGGQGFRGRGFGGRRGRGRGRGGWNQENQAGSSWGTSTDRNKGEGNDWGNNNKGWSQQSTDQGMAQENQAGSSWGASTDRNKGDWGNNKGWSSQSTEKGGGDGWNQGKGAEEVGGWGNSGSRGNAGGSSGWGKDASERSESWGKGKASTEQGSSMPGGGAWGDTKGSSDPAGNSWGAAGKWGDKNSSQGRSESGSWGQPQGQNGSGGWNSSRDGQSNGKWGKGENASDGWKNKDSSEDMHSWKKPSWEQSRGGDSSDQGGFRGRGRRGRGGNFGGRFQSGRGRGRSFEGGQFSSNSQENQAGSSWGNSGGGGSGWGSSKGWSNDSGDGGKKDGGSGWGGSKGWSNDSGDGKKDGGSGWGSSKGWSNDSGDGKKEAGSGWGSSKGWSNDSGDGKKEAGSGWGSSKGWSNDSTDGKLDAGSGWGSSKGLSNNSGDGKKEAGSGWGSSKGWSNDSGDGKKDAGSGWGSSKGLSNDSGDGKKDAGSGWGSSKGWSNDSGDGKKDGGSGWGSSKGWSNDSNEGKKNAGSGWGS